MKIIELSDFLSLLDKQDMWNISFLNELQKNFNIEIDTFFWIGPQHISFLKERVRREAHHRKWSLKNIIVIHRYHSMFDENGEFCLIVTVKTPEQFVSMCNRLSKMKAFL